MTEKEFVNTRVGFAIINGKVIFQETPEPTMDWMRNTLGLSESEVNTTIRGGLFEDRINFCVGKDYLCANMDTVHFSAAITLLRKHATMYPDSTPALYNGFYKDTPGSHWDAREYLGSIHYEE